MLLIKTKLAPSSIHGIGLVAVQFIAAGTIVWVHDDSIDRVYLYAGLNALPIQAQETIRTYGWQEGGYYIMPGDNARFINHSFEPNCRINAKGQSYAARNIEAGEEITESYKDFDQSYQDYFDKLDNTE